MSLLDQSGVTGGGLDPYNVHALFVNMDNMWTERFGNYYCLVNYFILCKFSLGRPHKKIPELGKHTDRWNESAAR